MTEITCPVCAHDLPTKKIYVQGVSAGTPVQLVFTDKAYAKIMNALQTAEMIEHQRATARAFKLHRLLLRNRK